jgi:GT2 family glycosyltransferase
MVSVLIVTWNSAQWLDECFAALEQQDYRDLEVVVVDNGSEDTTRDRLQHIEPKWRVIYNDRNVGFAAGQNQAIRASRGEWVLCLNPDVVLSSDCVTELVTMGEAHPEAGTVCGKLLRWDEGSKEHRTRVLDSTGIYFTRNMRQLDRGAEELDRGQYDRVQYVVGATGAAAMFRRSFIEDVSVEGQFFDEEFFSFREDADLAWRAQVMGWKCIYTPTAVAWHARRVTPERRQDLPLIINWHSVKNRFLMRGKNASGWLCWRLLLPVAWRDLMTAGYALLRDRRMISAVLYPWKARASIRHKRAIIQSRRRVADRDLLWWFSNSPRAIDVDAAAPAAGAERHAVVTKDQL